MLVNVLSTNIYFNIKLHIKNTKHGLYDEYGDVKIVLQKSLINKVRYRVVVVILVVCAQSMSI